MPPCSSTIFLTSAKPIPRPPWPRSPDESGPRTNSEINHAAQAVLRYPRANLSGKPLQLFVAMENREPFRTHLNKFLAQSPKTVATWSGTLHGVAHSPARVQFTVAALPDEGDGFGLAWLIRPI
jgi:hypothetical protein